MAIARAVFEGAGHLIVATDPTGRIIAVNPAAEQALGWRADELIGHATPLVFHDDDEVRARAAQLSAELGRPVRRFEAFVVEAQGGGCEEREWTYVRKDGSRFSVLLSVTRLLDAEGQLMGFLGVGTDIAERKRLAALEVAALADRRQRELADRANKAKSHFLAAASHDLRQPLQAASLYLATLETLIEDPTKAMVLCRARDALAGCGTLLDALLDISVLDAGGVKLAPARFGVAGLLEELAAEEAPMAEGQGLRLGWRGIPDLMVETDRALLARALRNLLVNALRYTPEGGVLMTARRQAGQARIQVWDTGIGIAPEEQDAIFDTFYQVGNGGRDRSRGLGLGLSVAEKTVRLLGGTIGVRSRPGKGSVFTIALPAAA